MRAPLKGETMKEGQAYLLDGASPPTTSDDGGTMRRTPPMALSPSPRIDTDIANMAVNSTGNLGLWTAAAGSTNVQKTFWRQHNKVRRCKSTSA